MCREWNLCCCTGVVECGQLISRMSAVMKFGPGAVEDPFVKVKQSITDVINKLQREASSEAVAGEDPFAHVRDLITDSINRLHSQASSEANYKPYRDDEPMNASEKKADPGNRLATCSSELEAAVSTSSVSDSEVAELPVDLCASSAQQLNTEDLDLDENPIIENTQISYPLHVNTDVKDGEGQQHTVEQIVDVPVSPSTF